MLTWIDYLNKSISMYRIGLIGVVGWTFIGPLWATAKQTKAEIDFYSGLLCLQLQHPVRANQFFQHSAQQGFPPALKALGDSYWSGDGVPLNRTRALVLYIQSADQQYGPAQLAIGLILSKGEAGFINFTVARYYFQQALSNMSLEESLRQIAQEALNSL